VRLVWDVFIYWCAQEGQPSDWEGTDSGIRAVRFGSRSRNLFHVDWRLLARLSQIQLSECKPILVMEVHSREAGEQSLKLLRHLGCQMDSLGEGSSVVETAPATGHFLARPATT
jgi:hypothetical protein